MHVQPSLSSSLSQAAKGGWGSEVICRFYSLLCTIDVYISDSIVHTRGMVCSGWKNVLEQ